MSDYDSMSLEKLKAEKIRLNEIMREDGHFPHISETVSAKLARISATIARKEAEHD